MTKTNIYFTEQEVGATGNRKHVQVSMAVQGLHQHLPLRQATKQQAQRKIRQISAIN